MNIKILAIGDVVGKLGCEFLNLKLKDFKIQKEIDLVIANGENSAEGNGITPVSAKLLLNSGADVVTTGNHVFKRQEIRTFLDASLNVLRPANYPEKTHGNYYCKINYKGIKIGVINLLGIAFMNSSLRDSFEIIDDILKKVDDCTVKILDFHAETTAEKRALGYYLDGKISAMFGTHTHVQTTDAMVLPMGTGYITDVGMTGVKHSVLGIKKEIIIEKMKTKLPVKFENAVGDCKMDCVIFEVDITTGKCLSAENFSLV